MVMIMMKMLIEAMLVVPDNFLMIQLARWRRPTHRLKDLLDQDQDQDEETW